MPSIKKMTFGNVPGKKKRLGAPPRNKSLLLVAVVEASFSIVVAPEPVRAPAMPSCRPRHYRYDYQHASLQRHISLLIEVCEPFGERLRAAPAAAPNIETHHTAQTAVATLLAF